MKLRKICLFLFVCLIFLLMSLYNCQKGTPDENQEIENLRAFTKLYGYVKYFHPSDEASKIDWDKFAIYGTEQIKEAKNSQELKTILEELFLPIAPTIQIDHSDEKPENPTKHLLEDTTGLKIVAWQHRGVGFGRTNTPYWSIRVNRKNKLMEASPYGFGTISQGVDATEYRGKEIRLKAFVKANVKSSGNQGQLWLRIDRENQKRGFFDNMDDRPIKLDRWKEYETIGRVDDDAQRIVFGCILNGMGQVWVDDFKLYIKAGKSDWELVKINNPGFEKGNIDKKPDSWTAESPGYTFKLKDEEGPPEGEKCLLMENGFMNYSGKLFEKHPEIDEVINKKIAPDLFCQIPLVLYSDEKGTLGKSDEYPFEKLQPKLDALDIDGLTANDENVRLGSITIAWNVFQHFYPYFDVVEVNWDEELTNILKDTLGNKTEKDFFYTLKKLIAKLQDGHGGVYHEKLQTNQAALPFKVDWIENQGVITVSKDTTNFHRGDIILTIDGIEAEQALLKEEEYISGSPQWKRFKSLLWFGYGDEGTAVKLKIKRGAEIFEIETNRDYKGQIVEPERLNIEELENNIYCVNLSKATMKEINEKINDLAKAKGVIFDLRGYPNGNHQVICHLLQEKDTSKSWMRVPQIIYPDQENIVGYQELGWGLIPKQPRIKGKIVFITDGRAISYAESFMSFIEHYELGEIVGQPTAGTNGNVNPFSLPGSFRVTWTGMKVLKHDGSQHHLIGIQPTVPIQRTINGIIEGRDEYMEKALEIIKDYDSHRFAPSNGPRITQQS